MEGPEELAGDDVEGAEVAGGGAVAFTGLRSDDDAVLPDAAGSRAGAAERAGRLEKARKLLARHGLGALVLTGGTSLSYFANIQWGLSERLLAVVLPGPDTDWTLYVIAVLLTMAIAGAGALAVHFQRGRQLVLICSLAYMVVVVLLRHTGKTTAAGYVPLGSLTGPFPNGGGALASTSTATITGTPSSAPPVPGRGGGNYIGDDPSQRDTITIVRP